MKEIRDSPRTVPGLSLLSMEVEVKKLKNAKVEMNCEMPWEEFKPYCARAFEALSKDVVLKGFRPGKAPKDLLEKEISRDKVLAQAVDEIVRAKYLEIISKEGLEPIGPPQAEVLKLAENNPFCFKIAIDVLPEVKLPDYKKIASLIEKGKAVVEDKEIEQALKWLQRTRAKFSDLPRPCQKGDFVEIEYQSPQIQANRVFQDGFVLGEGHFFGNFENNLEGLKTGEEKDFQEIFPQAHKNKDLAGKEMCLKVKMKKAQKIELPELNDEFAKALGKFENTEALKKNIQEGILREKDLAEKEKWRNKVLENIAKETDFDLPDALIQSEEKRLLEDLKERVKDGLNVSFEDYLKEIGKTEDELKKTFEEQGKVSVKNFLLLRELGKKEKIEVTDEEIEQAINNFLASYPQVSLKELDRERLKEYNKDRVYQEKVFQKLESF